MDEQEADIASRANHFIDGFIEKGECNFTEEFAELFPSAVFLGLMGLPWEELDTLLRLRDGILRPYLVDPEAQTDMEKRQAVTRATGQEIYAYFGGVPRRAREAADRRHPHPLPDRGDRR